MPRAPIDGAEAVRLELTAIALLHDHLDVPRFTDRYRPDHPAQMAGAAMTADSVPLAATNPNASSSSLKRVRMDRKLFPREIWRQYMDNESRREEVERKRQVRRQRLAELYHSGKGKFDWDAYEAGTGDGGVGGGGGGEGDDDDLAALDGVGSGDEAAGDAWDEAQGAYEDEDDDDYNEQHFDNGEDDAMDDALGDGGGGDD